MPPKRIGAYIKVDTEFLNEKTELENMIKERISLLPSFTMTRIKCSLYDGDNFINNKCTIRILYKQDNMN